MKKLTVLSALSAVVVAGVMLSGCSAVNAVANAQTKVQACSKIKSSFTAVGNGLSAESSKLTSDPAGASKKITAISDKFGTDANSLSNAQVKKAAQGAATQLATFSKDIAAIAKSPTTAGSSKLSADLPKLQASFTKVTTACKF
jgi:hypothetical protein